jgi:hypothetical protein
LQVDSPAHHLGNNRGLHPAEVVVVSLDDKVFANEIVGELAHCEEDGVCLFLYSGPLPAPTYALWHKHFLRQKRQKQADRYLCMKQMFSLS